jgi:hypothetical protein
MKENYRAQNTPLPVHRFRYLAIKNILTAILNEGEASSGMLLSVVGYPSAAAV